MHPAVFLVALLSTLGIAAFTVIRVARLIATRRESPSADVTARLEELERGVQGLQQELAETQERLDFTERLLSSAREGRRIGSQRGSRIALSSGAHTLEIRKLRADEHDAWLFLREQLWPNSARDALSQEQRAILADSARNAVLVAASADGQLAGFVEVALRDWAEGCDTGPVGYIEGWYVEPEHRRSGVGRRLVEAAEDWARSRGCTEMGSDAELANAVSHKAHRALGYGEVERLVLFSKRLK